MKLSEIEEALTLGKCTPELLEQFKSALRHSPKSLRAQHCYTTAVAMPAECFQQAVELIEYALEQSESWSDEMRAYHNLAIIHEKIGDYGKAINCYKFALAVIDPARVNDYSADYAFRMLVCLLHKDNFRYTAFLRRLYEESQELDEFSRSFQKCLFYLSLAEIVIHRHNGNIPAARAAYDKANSLLRPDYAGPLSALLQRKKYIESAGATPEARAFLKRIKNQLR